VQSAQFAAGSTNFFNTRASRPIAIIVRPIKNFSSAAKPPVLPLGTLERGLYREWSTLETRMATGTVKWFNPTKGYGFIQPTGAGKDMFVHISAVEQAGLSTLNEGQSIEYEIESNRGKESAVKLKVK
jgi:CspA family cold shock protein